MDARDDQRDTDGSVDASARRTRARWRKIRAATLVFLLFRRRVHQTRHAGRQPHRRMPTSVFFAKPSVQAATAAAALRLSAQPAAAAASPLVARWFAQKLQRFDQLTRKPIQNRDDVDLKLLAEFIRQTKFFHGLTSASIDALAQVIRFRTCHEGEVLHLQGSPVQDTSGRYLVVSGSLLVYKNSQYAQRAREGDDYVEWYLSNSPGATRDTIRYGDCVDTCSTGDITGDDATLEYLFRENSVIAQVKTVIASVMQTDYKRVIRFNVENESQVFEAVREILTPAKATKQTPLPSKAKDSPQPGTITRADLSPQQTRVLLRFLGRFKCFRVLPYQFCMDIISKLQLLTVKSDEVVCVSSDDQPSMVMVLDGKLCVHVHESHESQSLTTSVEDRADRKSRTASKTRTVEATEYLPGCEAGSTVDSTIGSKSLHVCSLTAGDSFGELAMSAGDVHIQGASIYHPFTSSGQATATIVRVYRHDYETAVQRYVESADFNLASVCSILSRTLPQDRTDEQVYYMKSFFQLRSSAKLFFGQIPSRILDDLLLHAGVETQDIIEDVDHFIQKEGSLVDSMNIVLNGYVGVFKCNPNISGASVAHSGVQDKPLEPKRAILRRYESRLIRANTRVLDTSGGKQSGRRASIQRNTLAVPNLALTEPVHALKTEESVIDPVSILPSGAAFGQLQILTGRTKSPYSYSAFASGPSVIEDSRTAARDDKQSLHLLSVPARFVHLCLARLDGQILYNPIRALKRLQHTSMALTKGEAITPALIQRLQVPLLLMRSKDFVGIPKMIAASMIEEMQIAGIEPHRVIFEVGEPIQRVLFAVLQGSVRMFKYVSKAKVGRDRRGSYLPGSDDKRPKLPRRISQETPESRQDDALSCDGLPHSFSKPAGDSIFLSDYNQTMEFGSGDCFGRNEHHTFAKTRVRRPSSGPLSALRQPRSQGVYTENVVSMTECLLGIITRHEYQCELSPEERSLLIRVIDDRNEVKKVSEDVNDNGAQATLESTSNPIRTAFRILEAMGLAHRLSTHSRVQLANRLKYLTFSPGETVFKQGELSEAVYFVLFGSVNLFTKRNDQTIGDPKTRGLTYSDPGNLLVDVTEGEVFGEESIEHSHGSTRLCTAMASVDDGRDTVLVYLTQSDVEQTLDGVSDSGIPASSHHGQSKKETSLLLLGLGQRTVTAKERWKMAIYQVIQLRAQRSQWPTVLTKARNHRIDLLLDLIKDLRAFEDTPMTVIKEFCCNTVLQTFPQDTMLFCKSDTVVDVCYLVVQGSVTLYQNYFGNAAANGSSSATPAAGHVLQGDSAIRVTIHTVEPGEIFGEFEMMEDHPRRHINASIAVPGTKVLCIQQADYFAFWPKREQQERKLSVLKTQLRNLCRLDADQLCSLYYGTKERSFRRNEVIAGSKEHAGYLHVIREGTCVVHDAVVLKQKRSTMTHQSPTKMSLDTRVSTLGAGAILFAERIDTPVLVENRRGSSRSLESSESSAPVDLPKASQYVVVDSPTVIAYSVQLFPPRILSLQRQPDLLVVFLLGKSGLQVIRDTLELQLKWRADNVAQTGRLVATAFSQNSDRVSEFAKTSVSVETNQRPRIAKVAVHQDISKALVRCESDAEKGPSRPPESPRKLFAPSPLQSYDLSLIATPQRATFGSFSPRSAMYQSNAREREAMKMVAPILPSLAASSTARYGTAPASPRAPRVDGVVARVFDPEEQLRKEERVLVSLQKPVPRQDVQIAQQQEQMRRRHGRPPPRRVENSSDFLDEHAVVPLSVLGAEHERKKAALFRLLHVKGAPQK